MAGVNQQHEPLVRTTLDACRLMVAKDPGTRLMAAVAVAAIAHSGQVDKAGQPYIGHPHRVAQNVPAHEHARLGDDVMVVAWLHDVVEDTSVTLGDVQSVFGLTVRDAVDAITHRDGEPRALYYARVRTNELARVVKRADVADNTDPQRLAALDQATRERLQLKYAKTLRALDE